MRAYILVSRQDLSNVSTRVFVQLLIISKDYDRDIDGAENGELMRLLEQAADELLELRFACDLQQLA